MKNWEWSFELDAKDHAPGLKITEIGILPMEWEIMTFSKVFA